MKRTIGTVVLAVALTISAVACEDERPVQTEGTVLIEGDSITWQFALAGGGAEFPSATFHTGPGWTMNTCVDGAMGAECLQPPLPNVREKVAAAAADTTVYLLGTNDANTTWNGGWSGYDDQVWTEGLLAPPGDACVTVVLPYTETTTHDIDEARSWMEQAAALLGNVHTVDWKPYALQPGVLDSDGVHLSRDENGKVTQVAYEARRAVIAEALAACA